MPKITDSTGNILQVLKSFIKINKNLLTCMNYLFRDLDKVNSFNFLFTFLIYVC